MKTLLLLFLLLTPLWAKPNIIFILTDDLGYGELGCYGQKVIQTPHIDRMAKEGIRFTHFYSGATVCAPSRSVLMTGQHHGHTRVRGNAGNKNPIAQSLRAEDTTVATVLQKAGYTTALIGKWGLGDAGDAEPGLPRKQGFDHFYGFLNQTHAHNHHPDFLWRNETREPVANVITPVGDKGAGYPMKAVHYADDLFAEESLKFISAQKEKPFFLYWSLVTPHANNEQGKAIGNGITPPDLGPYADKDWPLPDKGHAASITRIDSYVGRLMDELKKHNLAENTLVLFTSDNGPHTESRHDLTRFNPSGSFTGTKRALTDGGIRVPFIAWWPGKIQPAESDHVGYFGDFMATAAELAGAPLPPNLDSISLAPTLLKTGPQPPHEFLYWEFHEGGFKQAALYLGRWKAILQKGNLTLYDQKSDPAEQTDVAPRYPDIAEKITTYLATARTDSPDWPIK